MIKQEEKEQKLLKMWLDHKYWNSCCEDEAIDWCNHGTQSLDSVKEVADYVEWRKQLAQTCAKLSTLVSSKYYSELPGVF